MIDKKSGESELLEGIAGDILRKWKLLLRVFVRICALDCRTKVLILQSRNFRD